MDNTERKHMLQWIKNWEKAAPILEKDRPRRILEADTVVFIRQTAGLLHQYLHENGCRKSSGLVEQQRLFRSIRRD
jgi:hypothetical protein